MFFISLIYITSKRRQNADLSKHFNKKADPLLLLKYLIIGFTVIFFTVLPLEHRHLTISTANAADQPAGQQVSNSQPFIGQITDPDSIHRKILELVQDKKYQDALQLFTPEILDPILFPKIYSDYLVILIWSGNESKAISLYEALPESFAKRTYLFRNIAQAYYNSKTFLTAATLYQTVLDSTPFDEEAQKGLAKSLFMAGYIEKALENLDRFLLMSPNSFALLQLKADIFATQSRYLEAIQILGTPLQSMDIHSSSSTPKEESSSTFADQYKEELIDSVRNSLYKGDFAAGMKYMLLVILTEDYQIAIKAIQESQTALLHHARYTLDDIAEAYFISDQEQKFLYLFSAILDICPNHIQAYIGLAYYYVQTNSDQKALNILNELIEFHPLDVEARFARAFALNKAQRYWDAISEYDFILTLLPENPLTFELRLLTLSKMGISSYALERTMEELPDRNDLRKRFIDDMAVNYLHWDESDTAMELLQPLAEMQDNTLARFDYIVALAENAYCQEAIMLYEDLLKQGISTPWWLDEWIAQTYLNLKKPEIALALFNQVLEVQPYSLKSRLGKFYALQELRRWNEARILLHEIDNDTPDVRILPPLEGKNGAIVPNWPKLEIALAKGWFELYQDRLKEGQEIFEKLHQNAPSDVGIRHALAHSYLWRGWPRLALQEFNIIDSMVPEGEYQHKIGRIGALNQLGNKKEARKEVASLLSLYPKDRHVQDLSRELRVGDMHVFSTDMFFNKEDGGTQTNQIQFNISKNISLGPRFYGFTLWQEMENDNRTGKYHRGGLGIDHTLNDTFSIKQQFSASYDGGDEFGSFTSMSINPNDHLFLDLSYDSFLTNMPLQARLAEIDAQEISTGLTYRESDWKEYHVTLSRQSFSDTNNRDLLSLGYEQGLYAKNDWLMRLYVDTSYSQNSLETTPYFNPKKDWTISATHLTQHTIGRLDDRSFVHRLYITAGNYKQSDFSNEFIGSIRYEQEHEFTSSHAFKVNLSVERSVYDGESENSFGIHLSYHWSF